MGWRDLELEELVAEVFPMGNWKSPSEVEDHLTLAELDTLVGSSRRKTEDDRRFAAALKGIDLDKETKSNNQEDDLFEQTKRQAEAIAAGRDPQSAEDYEREKFFREVGIEIDTD